MRSNQWSPKTTLKRLEQAPDTVSDRAVLRLEVHLRTELAGCIRKGRPSCNGNVVRLRDQLARVVAIREGRGLELPGGA